MATTIFSFAESKDERTQARAALDHHSQHARDAAQDLFSELALEYIALDRPKKLWSLKSANNRQRIFQQDLTRLAEYWKHTPLQVLADLAEATEGQS